MDICSLYSCSYGFVADQSLITSDTSLTVRMRDTSLSYCSLPEILTVMKILAVWLSTTVLRAFTLILSSLILSSTSSRSFCLSVQMTTSFTS